MHSLINALGQGGSKPCRIKTDGIILDVDGTIWNTTSIVAAAWNEAAKAAGLDVPSADSATLKGEFGKTMSNIADDMWPTLSAANKTRLMAECCKYEQKALSLLNTAGNINAKDICYDGVLETVRKLCHNVPFFIVSNCQKGYVELVMEKTALADCITDFECYGNTGKGKAENIMALSHRNHLHCPIYIGDTEGDAVSCAEAGVPFVWAKYGFGRDVAAKYEIQRFEEIENVIYL